MRSHPMTAAPLLTVSGFTKTFGSFTAIDDVSFHVERGEILGLIGPNGAGKTTLFECLAGVLPATRGRLTHAAGQMLASADRASLIFYVPDGIRPYPEQPVGWVLDFAIGFFGGAGERKARLIQTLHLAPLLHTRMGVLSKGQAKRALPWRESAPWGSCWGSRPAGCFKSRCCWRSSIRLLCWR